MIADAVISWQQVAPLFKAAGGRIDTHVRISFGTRRGTNNGSEGPIQLEGDSAS